jgi:hypothetical protein
LTAVEWKDGKLIDLGRFGAHRAGASNVNAAGDILIQTAMGDGDPLGIAVVHGGKISRIASLGGGAIVASGFNDRGQVAGYGLTKHDGRRSFVWQNGRTTILPTFDKREPPWGGPGPMNAAGDTIGMAYVFRDGENAQHAVIWRRR